jgi:hypothetical protein
MLVDTSLSAGVLTLLMSVEQKSVQENTPVELVSVTSCKQVTERALEVFAKMPLAIFAEVLISVLTSNTGCVPVVFTVIRAIIVSP